MVKNNSLKSLRKKKDIRALKKEGHSFFFRWMQAVYLLNVEKSIYGCFALPKKHVPRAVDRNRLKRWCRESLKKGPLKQGHVLMIFLPKEKEFYKNLRRKDFDDVVQVVMGKISTRFK